MAKQATKNHTHKSRENFKETEEGKIDGRCVYL
jgi:hypothetical protein